MKLKWQKVPNHPYSRQVAEFNGLVFTVEICTHHNKRCPLWSTWITFHCSEYNGVTVYDRIRDAKAELQRIVDAITAESTEKRV